MQQDDELETGFVRPAKAPADNPLTQMPELYSAALDEFSRKSFDQASLNDIIKAAGMNKGRFYYRFKDKMDLYLCIIDRITKDKLAFFTQRATQADFPSDFFAQIGVLARAGMEFAVREPSLWAMSRRFMAEAEHVRQQVKQAFPNRGRDGVGALVQAAFNAGQFKEMFPREFVEGVIQMVLYNFDHLIWPDMTDDEMLQQVDRLMSMLQFGLAKQPD